MRTRYPGPEGWPRTSLRDPLPRSLAVDPPIAVPTTSYDALQQRIREGEKEAAKCSVPGRKWTAEQKSFYRSWRNYYPSLAYARNDPHTLEVAIDHAARMLGINQTSFYNNYLASGRLPYVVKRWRHGKGRPRRKSFVLRSALIEVLTKDLYQQARRQYVRRSRRRMAGLERELEERRKAEANGRNWPGNDDSRSRE